MGRGGLGNWTGWVGLRWLGLGSERLGCGSGVRVGRSGRLWHGRLSEALELVRETGRVFGSGRLWLGRFGEAYGSHHPHERSISKEGMGGFDQSPCIVVGLGKRTIRMDEEKFFN